MKQEAQLLKNYYNLFLLDTACCATTFQGWKYLHLNIWCFDSIFSTNCSEVIHRKSTFLAFHVKHERCEPRSCEVFSDFTNLSSFSLVSSDQTVSCTFFIIWCSLHSSQSHEKPCIAIWQAMSELQSRYFLLNESIRKMKIPIHYLIINRIGMLIL